MESTNIEAPHQAGPDSGGDELQWSLGKNGRHIEVTLYCGERGAAELRIRRDGQLCARHQFDRESKAVEYAQALDLDLQTHGWEPVSWSQPAR